MSSKNVIGAYVYFAVCQSVGIIGGSKVRAHYCEALTGLLSANGTLNFEEALATSDNVNVALKIPGKLTSGALHRFMAGAERFSGRLSVDLATQLEMSRWLLSALHQAGYRVVESSIRQQAGQSDPASQHGHSFVGLRQA